MRGLIPLDLRTKPRLFRVALCAAITRKHSPQPPIQIPYTKHDLKKISIPVQNNKFVLEDENQHQSYVFLLWTRSWTRSRTWCRASVVVIIIVLTIATATIVMSVVFFIMISSVYLSWRFFFHYWRSVSTFFSWALATRAATIATPITTSFATITTTTRPYKNEKQFTYPLKLTIIMKNQKGWYLDLLFFLLRRSSSRRLPLLSSRSRLRLRERERDLDRRSRERLRERDLVG